MGDTSPEDIALADYTIHGSLPPAPDSGIALRIVALLHRRGIAPVELRLKAPGTAARGEFAVRFRTSAARANTIKAGFQSLVNVENVILTRL